MIGAWFQQYIFIYMIPEDNREFLMYGLNFRKRGSI